MTKYRKTNKAKRVVRSCRNHGSCEWCKENRLVRARKESERTLEQLERLKGEMRVIRTRGYCAVYDADYDILTREWRSKRCGDEMCMFCPTRPPKHPDYCACFLE